MASAATFVIGLYAIRYLPPALLGVYALTFSAFVLVTMIPAQAVFLPAEIRVLSRPPAVRAGYGRTTLALGVAPSAASSLLLLTTLVVAPGEIPGGDVLGLVLTGMVCGWLSPMQDHIRRLWHLSNRSWYAALMSLIQLTAAAAAVAGMGATGLADHLVPFGALAAANATSLAVGFCAVGRQRDDGADVDLRLRMLLGSGKWLTVAGVAPAVSGFMVAALVVRLAGAESLGFAEAARVVAQPVHVIAMGLTGVLRPRSMEAGATRDQRFARRNERVFLGVLALFASAYVLAAEVPWDLSPLPRMLPTAYAVDGLVALTGLAVLLVTAATPVRAELMGARREVAIAGAETVASTTQVATGLAAGVLHAYAMPLSLIVMAFTRLAYLYRLRGSVYRAASKGR